MSLEQQNLTEAVNAADERINESKEDISANQKHEIERREKGIIQTLENYKSSSLIKMSDIIDYFVDLQISDDHTPTGLLTAFAKQFDDMRAANSQESGEQLSALASETLGALKTLKEDLSSAAASTVDLYTKVEKEYEESLPEYEEKPSDLADQLAYLSTATGRPTNIERIVAYNSENNMLLKELRNIGNRNVYAQANMEMTDITGVKFEDTEGTITKAFENAQNKLSINPEEAREIFKKAVDSAMRLMPLMNQILTNALFNPDYEKLADDNQTLPPERNKPVENDSEIYTFFREEEMAMIFEILLEGSKNPDWFDKHLDISGAYEYYSGNSYDDLGVNARLYGSATQGVLNVASGIGRVGVGIGKTAGDVITGDFTSAADRIINALSGILEVGKAVLDPDTYREITEVVHYGIHHESPFRLSELLMEVSVQFIAGYGLGKVSIAKLSEKMGKGAIGEKAGEIAQKTPLDSPMRDAIGRLARMANPVLQKLPSLAKYGINGEKITAGLTSTTLMITRKSKFLARAGIKAFDKYDTGNQITSRTSTVNKIAKTEMDQSPLKRNAKRTLEDINLALENGESLELTDLDKASLRQAYQELQTLIG